jgi:hypothetical protein
MPTPRKGEKKNKFMSRCISDVMGEGKEQKQAIAICFSLWSEHEKAEVQELLAEIDNFLKERGEK